MKNIYLVLSLFVLTSCSAQYEFSEICMNSSLDKVPTLEVELIDKMTRGYMENQLKRINNPDKKDYYYSPGKKIADFKKKDRSNSQMNDSQAIWFDFKDLKEFLYHIENYAINHDDLNVNNLGIRIYYTSYPTTEESKGFNDLKDVPDNYANKHTLIFIPTIRENNINRDLILSKEKYKELISNSNPNGNSTYPIVIGEENDSLSGSSNDTIILPPNPIPIDRMISFGIFSEGESISKNHGSLWPPDVKFKEGKSFPLQNR